jgi:uncharacterized protein (DUF362 family)
VRAQGCEPTALKQAIKKSLDLVNFSFDRKAEKIVIKPNMCYYYHPSTGEVTDPQFVSALIDVFRENFAKTSEILVVESDATAMKCKHVFRMLEYDKMAEEKGIKLVNLTQEKNRIINTNIGRKQFSFNIPELFHEADLVVNVPKPKYMNPIKITCALKNFFGCNAYPKKSVYHEVLEEAVAFINKQIKTNLVVVDGLVVNGAYSKRLNMILASENPVATDAAVSKLMGIDPSSVKQIVLASKEGIGTSHFTSIGDFSYFTKKFPKKSLKNKLREKGASAFLHLFTQL